MFESPANLLVTPPILIPAVSAKNPQKNRVPVAGHFPHVSSNPLSPSVSYYQANFASSLQTALNPMGFNLLDEIQSCQNLTDIQIDHANGIGLVTALCDFFEKLSQLVRKAHPLTNHSANLL